jgi:hypothetical protein
MCVRLILRGKAGVSWMKSPSASFGILEAGGPAMERPATETLLLMAYCL